MNPTRAGASAVAAVVGSTLLLLLVVTWAASIGPDQVLRGRGIQAGSSFDPRASPTPSVDRFDRLRRDHRATADRPAPTWLRWLADALELALVGGALALSWRLGRSLLARWRDRRGPPERSQASVDFAVVDAGPVLAQAIDADVGWQRVLVQTGDPRNAIVACWDRFESAAETAGVRRRRWQTSSEFVLEVLGTAGAEPGAVLRLADLYREARFSDHPITEDHRRRAHDELETIHHSLHLLAIGPSA